MATFSEPISESLPLSDVARTVRVQGKPGSLRRFIAFAGPALLVSVGYMDPGNWGTDLAGGSKYGYTLLWVILASNLMAQLLQILCVKLGIATGKDLAMACRDYYSKPVAVCLWLLCEVAIIACDLAEVIGSAIALNLLFGLPVAIGVIVTALDVFVLLALAKFGFRKIEAIILTLVATVFVCFMLQLAMANPDWGQALKSMVIPKIPNLDALIISLGILGATVMPHNLYLHSALVQTRQLGDSTADKREAIKLNSIDTCLALSCAFFVNAAILILAASVFHSHGVVVEELQEGHKLLGSLLQGSAATAFAVALLASGQSSTITGTLAGQVVMEGFLRIKLDPWKRRLITRGLAIIPALAIILVNGGSGTVNLLVISQVVLSMQLSFAVFPLVAFTSDPKKMGEFVNSRALAAVSWAVAIAIAGLNAWLLVQAFSVKSAG